MMNWLWKITGGRPMKRIGHAFRDTVSGEMVDYYQDKFGRKWLATSPWASFRVPKLPGADHTQPQETAR